MDSFERVGINRIKNHNKKLAKEVITGKLEDIDNTCYNSADVKKHINTMIRKNMNLTLIDIAYEVAEGKWGEGEICRQLLYEAGYDYNDVMREIKHLKL